MTMPDKIWVNSVIGSIVCADTAPDSGTEYTRSDLIAEAERNAWNAAIEAAADALQAVSEHWDCGHMESRLCDCRRDAEQWGIAADEVRALRR